MKNEKILQMLKDVTFDKMGVPSFNSNCICDDIEFAIFELEHPPIGIKDVNDKPIYAESSICEFIHKSKKQTGVVKYDTDYAYFYFDIKNSSGHIPLYMTTKIKIIDTIQENKLGLIK